MKLRPVLWGSETAGFIGLVLITIGVVVVVIAMVIACSHGSCK